MKIGIFTDSYHPLINGVAVSIQSLKQGLESLGHEVYVVTTNHPQIKKEENHFIFRIRGMIIPFKVFKDFRSVINYKKYLPQIEALNLDIIHVHTEAGIGHLGLYAHEKLKLPLVYTMHSMYHIFVEKNNFIWIKLFKKIILKYLDYILNKFISKANIIIVPTQKTLNFLKERYKIKTNYKIIPTGIKLTNFEPENHSQKEINILKNKLDLKNFFVCLFVGRISKEKDINFIIDNFSFFCKQNNQSKFLIIGDGPDKKNLQKKVQKLNLINKVIFLDFVPNDKIGLYYQLGNVFVSASLFETQGLTYIEALAAGLPVIARYDKALQGVIKDKKNGFFYKNKEEFTQILNTLSQDEKKYQEISYYSKKSIINYKQEIFAKKIIDIYTELHPKY